MATQKQRDIAAKVFKNYPKTNEVYQTSDGNCWVEGGQQKNLAELHRKHIKDESLTVIKREECATEIKALDKKEEDATKDANYKSKTVDALKALCAERKLDVPTGAIKADIISLLEAEDAKPAQ